ncbi:AcrR family transcriptional regulator [Actinoplanes campanulatus]|uniref:AcrR family transcriptional regulator n=1 Tax=Actinoplanes campanulatus TaxID=113559 RepID=A0A7W5FD43_9ACTN|nr:TetR/AcrR family transcriptional regulator [Actinoplanes campanulatus]MBB3093942.1 AcrR family transcriptional regulator [Actinoplanes campanulatus]GGN33646.1 TetR family transcriptional regulator [Actinoplanes campanulatus]GID38363.1 TetR family transcriptional regulator [Actinoplanes campanulatus]
MTTGETATPPRRRDAAKTRRLLLDAAIQRFTRDGYAATTVRDIADDAGVNVALISRYFRSKEGLFEACLTSSVDELRRNTGEAPLSRTPEAIARQIAGPCADGLPYHLVLLLRSSGDEGADRIRLGLLQSYSERLAAVAGWSPGSPEGDDLLLRAQVVLAAAAGIALLRTKTGLGPLAQATEEDLVPPLRDLVEALLKND